MNSTNTIYIITTLLAFALLSSVGSVFATGNLDDEEEEEVLEQLQTAVQEIQGTLGTLTLNLTEGSNNIEANCPTTAEIVEEVLENITQTTEEQNNVTEPEQNQTEPEAPQQCPVVQEPEQNNTVVEPPSQTVLPPVEAVEEEQAPQQNNNQTCDIPLEQNVTEVIEEIIENVTEPLPACNPISEEQAPPQTNNQSVIPGIVLPNITEPVEPVQQNETQQGCNPVPEPEPVQQNETVSELEPIYCPINGELLGYTNTTSGEQLPISAGENNQTELQPPAPEPMIQQNNQLGVQDEQAIASIEFEASCGCFVVDKTPEDLGSNGGSNQTVGIGNPEDIEQGLYY